MAKILAALGPSLDNLMGQLGIHGVTRVEAVVCILGATILLGFCVNVHSATRVAFRRCSVWK